MTLSVNGRRNVKVELKGLHKVRRRLADGSHRTHIYAWRGGPKIEAEHGTPAFLAEWQSLTAGRDKPQHHAGTLQELINAYQVAPTFTDLAAETREGYVRRIRKIEAEFGDLPIRAIPDPRTRGAMLDWRDAMNGKREADYCLTVLARILSWAKDRGRIPVNPLERPGRLYSASRAEIIWTDGEIEALLAKAAPQVRLPFLLALHTGQREGDVLRLTWGAYDGTAIRLRQSKGGRHVRIPVTAELKAALDATRRVAVTICATSRKRAWTGDGFRASFTKAKEAAKIEGRTFHDLRGTAVTRLAVAGCTVPEIATITGHDLKTVETILSAHYLGRVQALGDSAIAKLEKHNAGTPSVNAIVNGSRVTPASDC
jgi:integrase